MKTGLARRLDTLEAVVFAGPVPATPEVPPLRVFALRLLNESDEEVRARAARHRAVSESTQMVIIDLFEREVTS